MDGHTLLAEIPAFFFRPEVQMSFLGLSVLLCAAMFAAAAAFSLPLDVSVLGLLIAIALPILTFANPPLAGVMLTNMFGVFSVFGLVASIRIYFKSRERRRTLARAASQPR